MSLNLYLTEILMNLYLMSLFPQWVSKEKIRQPIAVMRVLKEWQENLIVILSNMFQI